MVFEPKTTDSLAGLKIKTLCFDQISVAPSQAEFKDKLIHVSTSRPLGDQSQCRFEFYGESSSSLKFLSSKSEGNLKLYYSSKDTWVTSPPTPLELWKLVEGVGQSPAKLAIVIADLTQKPTGARLACEDFSASLSASETATGEALFEIDRSLVKNPSAPLSKCLVRGEITNALFSTIIIDSILLDWKNKKVVETRLDLKPVAEKPVTEKPVAEKLVKMLGLNSELAAKQLAGLWSLKNSDLSCSNLEFRQTVSEGKTGLQYRFYRGEPQSCLIAPESAIFKPFMIVNREDEIPSQLRSKITPNDSLVRFSRTNDESSWSLLTMSPVSLQKLGNNILKPQDLSAVTEKDTYQKVK